MLYALHTSSMCFLSRVNNNTSGLKWNLKNFNFKEHLTKFTLLPPWVKGKELKLKFIKQMLNISNEKREPRGAERGSTKRMQLGDKKMMFNQARCISSSDSVSAQNWSLAVRKMQIFHPMLLNESKDCSRVSLSNLANFQSGDGAAAASLLVLSRLPAPHLPLCW